MFWWFSLDECIFYDMMYMERDTWTIDRGKNEYAKEKNHNCTHIL
jgi:hypothetical protein